MCVFLMPEKPGCHQRPDKLTTIFKLRRQVRFVQFAYERRHPNVAASDTYSRPSSPQIFDLVCILSPVPASHEPSTRPAVTSQPTMPGRKRAAPKMGRTKKVRPQRLLDNVIAYADSLSRSQSRTQHPRPLASSQRAMAVRASLDQTGALCPIQIAVQHPRQLPFRCALWQDQGACMDGLWPGNIPGFRANDR